jgi:hypothetical protein
MSLVRFSIPGLTIPRAGFVPHPGRSAEEIAEDVVAYLSGQDESRLQHIPPGHRWREWARAWEAVIAYLMREHAYTERPNEGEAADGDGDGMVIAYRVAEGDGLDAANDVLSLLSRSFWSDPGRSELMAARRTYRLAADRAALALAGRRFAEGVEAIAPIARTLIGVALGVDLPGAVDRIGGNGDAVRRVLELGRDALEDDALTLDDLARKADALLPAPEPAVEARSALRAARVSPAERERLSAALRAEVDED